MISLSSPELLYEVLSLFDDIDCGLQGCLLLLPETLDQVLNRLHRLRIYVIQQFLLQLLQPRPQLPSMDKRSVRWLKCSIM